MVAMSYHAETQKRYYEKHKLEINRKRSKRQLLLRKIAKLALEKKLIDPACIDISDDTNQPKGEEKKV